ncbi:multicomponent Na+:H+ antiporter subunit D [Clostridium tetanomorphum]|uniref:Monovalent cation/H+ antiporter subunit D family protein n=2 Tax=Clostridium tetanomorphum TaxID=1553 RepID=A0A923J1Q8_CLOTT|nr:proton-conducting transporter membrane subunit [Clostridium tetanomorphum]MBC2399491.1 monovalent cation/H+ antiporter subunit D family protein [Clostridium tetanomorphum]MBP1864156.1 multicomponent Na+:H+ antiporter subunit D [Clostridium tetanomorphum]NRS84569.1 multicomponent Na+:H+ antiporter subunit D [Clostridium tetanomorphum]NRZ97783.1 multicomponent Na+:H+ antiporter subunit D [Clostridium tetanomorphum]
MIINSFPIITVLLLFITASILPLVKKNILVKLISLFSFTISFLMYVFTLNHVLTKGNYFYRIGHFNAPFGIEFHVGTVESMIGVLFTFVAIIVIWYSIYNEGFGINEEKIPLYYLLINILVGSLLGIVFSNDMFNVFVFIEIGNLASCGIVIIKDKKENIKAGMKYLIMSCLGSGLVLMGIAFLYSLTGHLNMTYIHNELVKNYTNYPRSILITLGLFTVGLGVKSAMFPLHTWLPDAHSNAPTTSSAILSSLVLKGYVLFLIKILYRVFGREIIVQFPILNIILLLGCFGMIFGSIFAIFQQNLKRVIAYSTVAQMGYVFFAIGLGTEIGLVMSIFHIIGHAVTKAALFLCAGTIIQRTGHKYLKDLRGVGKEMPYTLALFFIASLSMVGIPLLPGFVSKWYLALGTIQANKIILIGVILASSLLNAIYYFPISIYGFFGEENLQGKIYKSKSINIKQLLPIVVLVIAMFYVGIASKEIISLIKTGLA